MSLITSGGVTSGSAANTVISADEILTIKELADKIIEKENISSLVMEVQRMGRWQLAKNANAYHYEQNGWLQNAVVGSAGPTVSGGKVTIPFTAGSVTLLGGIYTSPFAKTSIVSGSNNYKVGWVDSVSKPTNSAAHTITLVPGNGVSATELATYFPAGQLITDRGTAVNSTVGSIDGVDLVSDKYNVTWQEVKSSTIPTRADQDNAWEQEIPDPLGGTRIYQKRVGVALNQLLTRENLAIAFATGEQFASTDYGTVSTTKGIYPSIIEEGIGLSYDFANMTDANWTEIVTVGKLAQIGLNMRVRTNAENNGKLEIGARKVSNTNVQLPNWGSSANAEEQFKDLNVKGMRIAGGNFYFGTAGEFQLKHHLLDDPNSDLNKKAFLIPEASTVAYTEGGSYAGGAPMYNFLYRNGSAQIGSSRMVTTETTPKENDSKQLYGYSVQSLIAVQAMNNGKSINITDTGA
jgi:hypothetical protein